MVSANKPSYDFNFDDMTIGDLVIMGAFIADTKNTGAMTRFLAILPKFTNTAILDLPAGEVVNLLQQAIPAISNHLQDIWGNQS